MSEEKILSEREVKEILENVLFEKLSEEYLKKRKKERDGLKAYLQTETKEDEDGIRVKAIYSFNPRGKTRNWIGIDVIVEDNNNGESAFFISFQPFDLDTDTGNFHTIMNGIGLYLYHDEYLNAYNKTKESHPRTTNGPLKTVNGFLEMELLENIQLPLDKTDKKVIWDKIKDIHKHKDEHNKEILDSTKKMIINIVKNFDEKTEKKKIFITELIEELKKELDN